MKLIFIRPFSAFAVRAPVLLPAILALAAPNALAAAPVSPASEHPATPLSAPAYAGSSLRAADLRVASVVFRLARYGTPLCRRLEPLTGIVFHHLPEYAPADRPGMISRYGLDRGPGVLAIVGDSPAAKVGLEAGDVLLSVDGKAFVRPPDGTDSKSWRPLTDKSEDQLEDSLRAGPADLIVLRGGRERALTLDSLPACFGRVRLAYSNQVNAFSTGHEVVMTTAMLGFVRSDDELAIVLGHELAHQILGHPPMRNADGLLAAFGIKAGEYWQREAEADRLGLRLAAAAGYDLEAAIPFWRRYLGKYDWYPQLFRSHPSLKARERIVREEMEAIAREKATAPNDRK